MPPSAAPSPSRLSSSSVVLESAMPAIQVAADASTNTATSVGVGRPAIATRAYATQGVRSQAGTAFVDIAGGARLAYDARGGGRPAAGVHGASMSPRSFERNLDAPAARCRAG